MEGFRSHSGDSEVLHFLAWPGNPFSTRGSKSRIVSEIDSRIFPGLLEIAESNSHCYGVKQVKRWQTHVILQDPVITSKTLVAVFTMGKRNPVNVSKTIKHSSFFSYFVRIASLQLPHTTPIFLLITG